MAHVLISAAYIDLPHQINLQTQKDEIMQFSSTCVTRALQDRDHDIQTKTVDMEQHMQEELDKISKAMIVCLFLIPQLQR